MLDLRLWQNAYQAARPLLEHASGVGLVRHGHSAGARKVAQLERELARLKATSLEQLQEEARQQAKVEASTAASPEEDLHNLALETIRQHSTFNMPLVPGQKLKGTVIRVDRRTVWIDVGLGKHTKFFRSQVPVSQVVKTTSTDPRTGPNDIHVGDVLHVILETTETPFGDPAVSLTIPRGAGRHQAAVNELRTAFEEQQPVMGRILNPLNGGYAVGVGGIVAFCPFRNCSLSTASRVGVLQPFYVTAFREDPLNMILTDLKAYHPRLPKAASPETSSGPPDATQSDTKSSTAK